MRRSLPPLAPRRALALTLATIGVCMALAGVAQAATIDVTTTADPAGSGTCPGTPCSLRQAVAAANSGDTIQLAGSSGSPAVYALTLGSEIIVNKSLTIAGEGIGASTVNGSANFIAEHARTRILKVTAGTLKLENLTLSGGFDEDDELFERCSSDCRTLEADGGGALLNEKATVMIEDVAFDGDGPTSGQPLGGGVANDAGTLDMTDVSFVNDGAAFGGGLFSRGGTISANDVTFDADGLSAFGGGAIFLFEGGTASFSNTTVVESGWPSAFGGGIDNSGSTLTLTNDTISGNLRGGLETDVGASTAVQDTIIGAGFSDGVDFGCVGPGKGNNANTTTANAITEDRGNNLDQDNHCGLDAAGDQSGVDPKLAPIAENGGPIQTQALLHGSAAIDAGNDGACPATDARGIERPQGTHCDVGAFEAVLLGQPSATTDAATNVVLANGTPQATLHATVDLAGEAGGFHFLWGTSPAELINETAEVGAGLLSSNTGESETLGELSPQTKYYFKAVADNASGSVAAGNLESFTTPEGPGVPVISAVSVIAISTTIAAIEFTINPEGAETSYQINYGPDVNYGQVTEPGQAGASREPQHLSQTITGLEPDHTYHFDVLASNSQAVDGVSSEDHEFTTAHVPQVPTGGGGEQPVNTQPSATLTSPAPATTPQKPPAALNPTLPPPTLGKSVNVEVVSGTVFVALPATAQLSLAGPLEQATASLIGGVSKGLKFIPLTQARQIPVGSVLETTAGVARITTATATVGKTQSGEFGAGIFKLLQSRKQKGLTEMNIIDNVSASQVCASVGKAGRAQTAAKHLSAKVLGRLTGADHGGHFATKGQYSASTVRGTVWSVANQCDGTLTKVASGVVSVRDFHRRKTITLHAGRQYLARASA